jgi:hypothetical protein
MNTRINTVFFMVVTLGFVLSIGILTTIHSQQAFVLALMVASVQQITVMQMV